MRGGNEEGSVLKEGGGCGREGEKNRKVGSVYGGLVKEVNVRRGCGEKYAYARF